jgi:hypothetical protein
MYVYMMDKYLTFILNSIVSYHKPLVDLIIVCEFLYTLVQNSFNIYVISPHIDYYKIICSDVDIVYRSWLNS